MNVPALLPDELAGGYLGRFLLLNGLSPNGYAIGTLNDFLDASGVPLGNATWIERFAALAGLSAAAFTYQHTMGPFYRAVQATGSTVWLDEPQAGGYARVHKPSAEGMFLCAKCVEEDLSYRGVSYWRRSHQMHGVVWCHKHEMGLMRCDRPGVQYRLPQDVLSQAANAAPRVVDQALRSDIVRRYADVCAAFLEHDRSVCTYQIVECLQARASQLEVRPHAGVRGRHISDLAEPMTRGPWQRLYFPDLVGKPQGVFVDSLDRTYTSRRVAYTTQAYALALAVLYDSAADAFADLSRAGEPKPDRHRSFVSADTRPGMSDGTDVRGTELRLALQAFLNGKSIADACACSGADSGSLESALRTALRQQARTQ